MAIEGLHHIGIYTRSVDESLAFYTKVLEFKKRWRGIVDHPTGKLDVAIISMGDCVIELVRPADLSVITPESWSCSTCGFKGIPSRRARRETGKKGN